MYIDLSVIINDKTPVYPGDQETKVEPSGILQDDGYEGHYVSIGTHVGTHIDAPSHVIAGGKTLDQLPIDQFIGRGRYIRVENKTFDINNVKHANIQPGDIVLFNTGLSKNYHEASYFEDYPSLPEDIANYLVGAKVKMVGFDMCSPDHEPLLIHKTFLGADILIIENLINLELLAGKEFTVYALPMNLQLDGSPARVIARLKTPKH